ncbi:MAG: hypothetical protein QG556_1067 [Pseudomonadota bacterium]|nr:hypothetical protein [Pseudomonadota bacterium]
MHKDEALQLLKLQETPSTDQILSQFNLQKTSSSENIETLEKAKDILLIENLRHDCLSIGDLIKNCGLELEIRVIPPYIQTKIEFEEHKRNLVVVSFAAIKDQGMAILEELKAWDELKRHPNISQVMEYFHFENHLPKLYQEYFTHALNDTSLTLEKLTDVKISLQNYRKTIFTNLQAYGYSIINQFRQAKLCLPATYRTCEDKLLGCDTIKQLGQVILRLIEEEQVLLEHLKDDCASLEHSIKGLHAPKPSHVFSSIMHWSTYKSLLLHELKNQSMMQQFHLCKDFAKEEVSWMSFFNFISEKIDNTHSAKVIFTLEETFKQAVLDYYEIKEWFRIERLPEKLHQSIQGALGLIPPNLRYIAFEWIKNEKFSGNILVEKILDKTLELTKKNLMNLAGIAPYSNQIQKTHSLKELSEIDILMK